jgi:hypothetical protein
MRQALQPKTALYPPIRRKVIAMQFLPEPFPGRPARGYEMRTAIDWNRFRAVVFESDDWGACEHVRSRDEAAVLQPQLEKLLQAPMRLNATLETPHDLQRLYATLETARGCDGFPAVFTAFMCLGNPDYAAIEASDFCEYHDIGLGEGVPPGWERGDLIGAWRDGVARGVFAPEFHAGLHHTSPQLWLELLRGEGAQAQAARVLFQHNAYVQRQHLPEYHGMNARAQHEWVSRAVRRFQNLFGFAPHAGVTSDATLLTEVVWSVNGLEVFCLKNARNHRGEVIVYHTKPWNSQDIYCPMGAYNAALDLVYLGRNVHLDGVAFSGQAQELDEVTAAARACWERGEPVVINTHRGNYVNLDAAQAEQGRGVLAALLQWLAAQDGVRFLTTAELGQLYRDGYSLRAIGAGRVLRQWSQPQQTVRIPGPVARVSSLPSGHEQKFCRDGEDIVLKLEAGDYFVQ